MTPTGTHLLLALPTLLGLRCGESTCPADMVRVPGGTFTMGVEEPLEDYEEPSRSVQLAPYCMDRFEFPNREGEAPVHSVSWVDADQQCRALGKRLCTSAEWERACRGTAAHRYAYGRNRLSHFCNTPWRRHDDEHGRLPLATSGSHPKCVSEDGVYDLNGNLSEWVADEWEGGRQPMDDELGREHPMRIVRGGTMWADTFYGQDCLSRHGHPANAVYDDDGFRCCMDVP